ncbi:mucin-2-like [Saccostrea cucullata]|uniref:mucin-2-like n=1 Tax=Saccostrea cuccullata TaxID=36930 RepID=UPI002ED68B63
METMKLLVVCAILFLPFIIPALTDDSSEETEPGVTQQTVLTTTQPEISESVVTQETELATPEPDNSESVSPLTTPPTKKTNSDINKSQTESVVDPSDTSTNPGFMSDSSGSLPGALVESTEPQASRSEIKSYGNPLSGSESMPESPNPPLTTSGVMDDSSGFLLDTSRASSSGSGSLIETSGVSSSVPGLYAEASGALTLGSESVVDTSIAASSATGINFGTSGTASAGSESMVETSGGNLSNQEFMTGSSDTSLTGSSSTGYGSMPESSGTLSGSMVESNGAFSLGSAGAFKSTSQSSQNSESFSSSHVQKAEPEMLGPGILPASEVYSSGTHVSPVAEKPSASFSASEITSYGGSPVSYNAESSVNVFSLQGSSNKASSASSAHSVESSSAGSNQIIPDSKSGGLSFNAGAVFSPGSQASSVVLNSVASVTQAPKTTPIPITQEPPKITSPNLTTPNEPTTKIPSAKVNYLNKTQKQAAKSVSRITKKVNRIINFHRQRFTFYRCQTSCLVDSIRCMRSCRTNTTFILYKDNYLECGKKCRVRQYHCKKLCQTELRRERIEQIQKLRAPRIPQ